MKRVITLLFIIAVASSVKAQQVNLDSLYNYYLNEENPDSLRGLALNTFAWEHKNFDSSIYYFQKLIKFGSQLNSKFLQAKAFKGIGRRQGEAGNIISCKSNLDKAIAIFRELDNKKEEAGALINLGANFMAFGHTTKAIYYVNRCVKICEDEKIMDELANGYMALSGVYFNIEDYDKALEYAIRSKNNYAKMGAEGAYYTNIGMIMRQKGAYAKSIRIISKSLTFRSEQNLQKHIANANIELGKTYLKMNAYDSAKFHLTLSIELLKGSKNEYPILLGEAYVFLGELHLKLNAYTKAITFCQQSVQLAQEIKSYLIEEKACDCLITAYKESNNGIEAIKYYERKTALGDSLRKAEDVKKLQQIEFEKQMIMDSLERVHLLELEKVKEVALKEAKERKNRIQYSLVVIVVLLLATVIAVVTRFSISPRLASGLVFIFFILTFEFLLVVLDPWVDSVSNGEVGWKIGINTAIALVLFGIHQVSEKRLKSVLIKVDS